MHKQLQDLVDVFRSDEDLKHLEIEIDEVANYIDVIGGLHKYYETLKCLKLANKVNMIVSSSIRKQTVSAYFVL